MATRFITDWPQHLRQIQLITANSSEGVIMIDVNQAIRWANAAALAMHGVAAVDALGRTIDEYHANFQVKFRGAQAAASEQSIDSIAAGQAFRDVVIEVTPLQGDTPHWAYRVRNLVLVDDAGAPTCVVLVLRGLDDMPVCRGQFAATVNAMPNPAAILRLSDLRVIEANEGFLHMTGRDRAAVLAQGLTGADFLAQNDDPAALEEAIAGARPLAYLKPRSALDAQNRPVLLQALPVACDEQACMLVNFVEMAGQGAGEQPWAAASADVLKLCAVAPGPMHVLDDDMRIVGVSQSWLDWLGYGREAVTGRFVGDFMTTSSAAHFQTHTWEMLANAGAVRDLECEFVTRHGVTVTALVSARVTQGHGGMPRLVVATPVDITERKRSEESFVKLFGLSPVPMLMRKLDDPRILDVNDAFTVATGLTAENIVGHSIDELGMFEARSQRQQFETALRGPERVQNMEVRLKTAFGDMLDCLLSAQKVNAFGQTCALLVLQDVSDRRRNEMQLFEAIETVMEDTSWFSRAVIEKLAVLRSPPRSGGRSAAIGDLTPREREVLGLISHGLADVDIALKLGLTRSTVRNHVATLYSKIGVHSRSSAIIWARERGINLAWPSNGAANFIARPIAPAKASAHAMVAKTRRA